MVSYLDNEAPIEGRLPDDVYPSKNAPFMLDAEEKAVYVGKVPVPIADLTVDNVLTEREGDSAFVEALEKAYMKLRAWEIGLAGAQNALPEMRDYPDAREENALALYVQKDGSIALFDPQMPEAGGITLAIPKLDLPQTEIAPQKTVLEATPERSLNNDLSLS